MAASYRHADSGRGDADFIIVHDLMGFIHHLHFFLGVVIVQEDVDLGNQVISDLIMLRKAGRREDLRFVRFAFGKCSGFVIELIDPFFAGAGNSLVRADHDAFDTGQIVNRFQRHQHDDGGAIRIGDDAFVFCNVFRVDFRDNQRHLRIHTEGGGVIDDYSASLGSFGSQSLADAATGEEGYINVFEGFRFRFFYSIFLTANHQLFAGRAFRCQKLQGSELEISFFKQTDKFLADSAGSAQNGYAREFTHDAPRLV